MLTLGPTEISVGTTLMPVGATLTPTGFTCARAAPQPRHHARPCSIALHAWRDT